jgi:hypothetical protein
MPGVPRELIEHELHLHPKAKLVKQRHRCFTQNKKDVIKKEIAGLLDSERYLNHTPSSEPIPRRRYLASVYNDRLLEERRHKFWCRPYTEKPPEGLS